MVVRKSFQCQVLLSPDWPKPLAIQAFSPYILAFSLKLRRLFGVARTIKDLQTMRSQAVHPRGASRSKVLRGPLCGPSRKTIKALSFYAANGNLEECLQRLQAYETDRPYHHITHETLESAPRLMTVAER
jgi:hypothetical protein